MGWSVGIADTQSRIRGIRHAVWAGLERKRGRHCMTIWSFVLSCIFSPFFSFTRIFHLLVGGIQIFVLFYMWAWRNRISQHSTGFEWIIGLLDWDIGFGRRQADKWLLMGLVRRGV